MPNHWAKKVTRSRERELWRNQVRETCKQRTDLGSSFEYYGRTSRCSQLLLFLFLPPPQHSTQSSNFRCHISRAERSLSPSLSFFLYTRFLSVCVCIRTMGPLFLDGRWDRENSQTDYSRHHSRQPSSGQSPRATFSMEGSKNKLEIRHRPNLLRITRKKKNSKRKTLKEKKPFQWEKKQIFIRSV